MHDDTEMPLGLAMQMAMNEKARNAFSNLPEQKRQQVIDEAKQVSTKSQMEQIVSHLEK